MNDVRVKILEIAHYTGIRYSTLFSNGKYLAFLIFVARENQPDLEIKTIDFFEDFCRQCDYKYNNPRLYDIISVIYKNSLHILGYPYETSEALRRFLEFSDEELKEFLLLSSPNDFESPTYVLPQSLYQLTIDLLDIEPQHHVLDQLCGTGEFLFQAREVVNDVHLFGHDSTMNHVLVAKIKAYIMHCELEIGVDENLRVTSFIENDKLIKFDRVFSLFPWSLDCETWNVDWVRAELWDHVSFKYNKKNTLDWLFIGLTLNRLKKTGKAAIITTQRALKRKTDQNIRKLLIENGSIESVIELPRNLEGLPNIRLFIIILSQKNNRVAYIDASNIFVKQRNGFCQIGESISALYDDREKHYYFDINQLSNKDYSLIRDDYIVKS